MTSFVQISVLGSLALLSACSAPSEKQRELDLKERELKLREKELELQANLGTGGSGKEKDSKVAVENALDAELSNVENVIGYWFIPHNATVNIKFLRNGSFKFNDYNTLLGKEEVLRGTYQLRNGSLTLLYDDRPKQSFRFYKGNPGDKNYYIKGSAGYYFVKGENGYDETL